MCAAYTVLVVTDRKSDISEIGAQLTALRSKDIIVDCIPDKTIEFCRKYLPDVVVVFAHHKNEKLNEICKIVRADPVLKNLTLIFVFDFFDKDFISESFKAGISSYMISPIKKVDILAHLTPGFEKSELLHENEIKNVFLKDLGVIDKNINFYTAKFTPIVFEAHINVAKKYKYPITIMAICLDSLYKNRINSDYLAKVIKKSLRSTDVFGIMEQGKFYILLPKTDLASVHTIYGKILKNLGGIFTVSAGVCEITDYVNFNLVDNFVSKALEESLASTTGRLIVYSGEQFNIKEKYNPERQDHIFVKNNSTEVENKNWIDKIQGEKKCYDSFKVEFSKKIKNIISPVFYKMRDNIKIKYPGCTIVDQIISDTRCFFSIKEIYEGTENTLQIIDPGWSYIQIERCLIKAGKQTFSRYNIELNDLTDLYIEKVLLELFNEFEISSDLENLIQLHSNV